MIKFYAAFVLTLAISSSIQAQKQANIWHFGDGRCLDFSSGAPVVVSGSAMNTPEGCASYCDSSGNFLFYTNGGGRELGGPQDFGNIWNRNNVAIYDMKGTEGGGYSSAQSSVIFEAPGQDSVYYLFTMDEAEWDVAATPATIANQPGGRGLSYFKVDMRLNGGLGGVVLADQRLYTPSGEGLCAIRHANKRDYWVLFHKDTSGLGVYLVTPSGITFNGVYTNPLPSYSSPIKASPDGKYVATLFINPGGLNTMNVLQFDNSTGQFSNPVAIPGAFAQEFSPNSRYVYAAKFNLVTLVISILQYDLQAPNVLNSATVLSTVADPPYYSQLAPDGKIYYVSLNSLDRINCPNNTSASIQQNVISFGGVNNFYSLPNFPAWLFEKYDSTAVSLGPDTIQLCQPGGITLDAGNPGASYLWSTGATTQSILVNTLGTYSVTVTSSCLVATDQIVVIACCSGTIAFTPDSCIESEISFSINSNTTANSLNWNFGDPNSGTANTSTALNPVHKFSSAGTYIITAVANFSCGTTTLTRTIIISNCDSVPEDCKLILPNVITPNGDGVNDGFQPSAQCAFESYSLKIFDRWGKKIYKSTDATEIWNGKYDGTDVQGVVYYLLEYNFPSQNEKKESGFVTIIR
jgi:gliding motility-associated-like protein